MSGEGFLDRWSARKRAARQETEAARPQGAEGVAPEDISVPAGDDVVVPPGEEAVPAEPAAREADEPIDAEELARLTPVEEATSSVELRPYLRRGVPAALRKAALRRMWSLNPAIRDYVDPALDYAWDFNAPTARPGAAAGVASLAGTFLREAAADPVRTAPEPRKASPVGSAPAAVERSAPDAANPARDAVPAAEAPSNTEDTGASTPRRRHGGAMPRVT